MEAIADHVIGLLNSLIAKELDLLCNFKDDLDKMKRKMHKIRAVLHDAEKKATRTEAIRIWLENLKDELLDADDLLDAYLADELAREVMTKDKMAQEVRIFFSKSNRIVCAYKMGCKIRAIFKNLDEIYKEKNQFMLDESSSSISNESHQWRLNADSFVSKQAVIGRDEERRRLVSTLLNPDVKSDVSVVPIVGIGGSGKTALAQLVCNDVSVKNHFEPIMRVCVSDETHPLDYSMLLAQKIIGGQQTFAQMEVSRKVEGKRFLLLLDDVWNIKNRWEWLKLQNLFIGGRKGSMIIVTTRSMEVADTMGKDLLFPLEGLGEDESWELFCRVAFLDGKEPDDNQGLVNIGKDIVRKCAGVPLAISTIGSLLSKKGLEVSEWSYIRDQELANIDLKDIGYDDNIILSILKLSYDHLPSHLKNCFAFCSLFPKDYEIERKVLIQMWIAEGFIIRPSDANKRLEVVGDEYFMQLLSRCLFQNVERDSFGEIKQCKMHDLIHDLAKEITKNESYIVTSGRIEEENIGNGIRHMSSHFDGAWKFPFGNVKTKRVRTILSSKGKCYFNPSHSCWSTTSLPKHLRALDLTKWLEIPKSIGYLKHLRYLDLSGNLKLKKLPRGITKVHNLLSLRLNGCTNLRQLPRDMKRLVKLTHLELDHCSSLICMPRGLGSLSNLQTFTTFVVDKRNGGGARISELCDLTQLRGGLKIRNLERQRSNIEEVQSSKFLRYMKYLEKLSLTWLPYSLNEESREDDELRDEMILEALEPPHTIKILTIEGFCGKCLSKSIGSLTSLQELSLHHYTSLASLPESIGSLTSLQKLSLDHCTSLASLPESIGSLTSLQKLSLYRCTSLASLPKSIRSLTSLQELSLNFCTSLASLPKSIGSLTSLEYLSLFCCSSLASLPDSIKSLTSLKCLVLNGCSALKERYGQKLEGFNWPMLAHIPGVHID